MHRINFTLINRYRFFREHAGSIVGRAAESALALARAERLLDEAEDLGIAFTTWELDEEPYDVGDVCTEDEARAKFESNEWSGPFICSLKIGEDEDTLTSLSSVVLGPQETDDPYARVVRAELASEIEDDLRQAVSDYLDSLDGALY